MTSADAVLVGSYDLLLVALSVIIAILAAYAALDFAGRVTSARGRARGIWLAGGATSMGLGIWSMHYIGMLAFRLPIPVQYDWPTVLLSLVAAVFASAVALFVVSRERMGIARALLGSVLMGSGIAAMHYIGMAAMRLAATHHYSIVLVTVSVILAIVISLVALWITFTLRRDSAAWSPRKIVSALIMGSAIPVMHYTGMAAATFTRSTTSHHDYSHAVSVSSLSATGIVIVTVLVVGFVPVARLRLDTLSNTRRLMVRYFLFLIAMSLLALIGALLVQRESERAQSDARVINIAGRQRMLSQAIAKDVALLMGVTYGPEREQRIADLRSLQATWEHAHVALQEGDTELGVPGGNSTAIVQGFHQLEPQYNALREAGRAFILKASENDADLSVEIQAVLAAEGPYLNGMEVLVSQFEREGATRGAQQNLFHLGLLGAILGVLLLQGILVLRPALARIQQGISDLETAKYTAYRKAKFVELLQSVAAAANEATSVVSALQFTLDRVCAHTGWPIGHVYLVTSASGGRLISAGLWHVDEPERFQSFCDVTARTSFDAGVGLPGRVQATGKAIWVPDIPDANFPRRDAALALGIRGAFGFPVLVQGQVVAVLEFFSRRIEEPDEEMLTVMSHVGAQLGQVVERTRAQQALAEKAEELARSNAELEQFAYVASHDLQEPLRMVASYTQLLARRYKGKLDSAADEFIAFAVDGATRMQYLIQDLLSYSRLTTKGQNLQPTDAAAACKTALDHLRGAIESSNAKIAVGELPQVMAYSTQLTQLFQNLIGNAIKYCKGHVPEVAVSAQADGERWRFSVRDNGIGIEPQYFERIFQMFQRLHTREQYSGTGIGLAICRKIAERHGGRIWVESQPGQGSNFQFTLPRAQESDA